MSWSKSQAIELRAQLSEWVCAIRYVFAIVKQVLIVEGVIRFIKSDRRRLGGCDRPCWRGRSGLRRQSVLVSHGAFLGQLCLRVRDIAGCQTGHRRDYRLLTCASPQQRAFDLRRVDRVDVGGR